MVLSLLFSLCAGKHGSNNMLAIGNTYEVQAITFQTLIVLAANFWSHLTLAFGSWVGLASIVSCWLRLTKQKTSASMLISLDLCTHVLTCSYLGSWTWYHVVNCTTSFWVYSLSFCKVVAMLISFVITLSSFHWLPSTTPFDYPSSSFDMSISNFVIYSSLGLLWLSIALEFKGHIPMVLNLALMFCLDSD